MILLSISPAHLPHYWNIMTFICTSMRSGFRFCPYKRTLCQVGRISLKLLVCFPQPQIHISGRLHTPGNGSSHPDFFLPPACVCQTSPITTWQGFRANLPIAPRPHFLPPPQGSVLGLNSFFFQKLWK
jgi:hypothetical protein